MITGKSLNRSYYSGLLQGYKVKWRFAARLDLSRNYGLDDIFGGLIEGLSAIIAYLP